MFWRAYVDLREYVGTVQSPNRILETYPSSRERTVNRSLEQVGAFGERDNVWFLERSHKRQFMQQVRSTVQLATLNERSESPAELEPGADDARAEVAVASERRGSLAQRALDEDVDDETLNAIGNAPDA